MTIEDRRLSLSNLDKLLYPQAGFTKGHVIDYYTRIAPVLLPHLRDRALTLKRYPNGVEGGHFYEKRCPSHRPDWVRTAAIWSGMNQGDIDYCVADDLATLVWLANLADLELHTTMARASDPELPACVVFDLDPGPPATIVECAGVALRLRESLASLGLTAFAKSSGSKGMQVYVPLNTPGVTFDETKAFALTLAQHLEGRDDVNVVSDMKRSLRGGKVLVDWSQNTRHKTTVTAYSLRAKDEPTVSTPLRWEEVEAVREADELRFTAAQALERVAAHGDLFAPVQTLEQRLPR